MKILITGATGFVGRHLLEQLQHDSNITEIIALLRNPKDWATQDWNSDFTKVSILKGGLNDREKWQDDPLLEGVTGIFHLAAMVAHNRREGAESFAVNVDGTLAMVEVAAKLRARLVYMSTSGVVGCFDNPHDSCDETSPYVEAQVGRWPYYASKIAAEKQSRTRAEELGVDLVILRPPIMLGPGDHRFRSTGLLIKFLRGKLPFIIEGGFPFVDVRDASAAAKRAMLIGNPKPIYHLPGTQWKVGELFQKITQISGIQGPRFTLPPAVVLAVANTDVWLGMKLKGAPLALVPDPVVIEMGISYWGMASLWAADELNFNPRDGEQTLKETLHWLLENEPNLQQTSI